MDAKRAEIFNTKNLVALAVILGMMLPGIFTIANLNYLHLEISFSVLLVITFIISLITKKEVIGTVLGTFLWFSLFYTFSFAYGPYVYHIRGSQLFSGSLLFISFICYLLFSHFFIPEKEEKGLLIRGSFLIRRESFGLILALVILFPFLKIVLDLQIWDISFVISKEGLSDFYGIIARVFSTILAIMVTMTIFILSTPSKLSRRARQIFIKGVKGIAVFEVAAIFLSIMGALPHADLYFGKTLSYSDAGIALIFFVTILLSLIGLISLIILLTDILEVRTPNVARRK
jgi:hypothetical protein